MHDDHVIGSLQRVMIFVLDPLGECVSVHVPMYGCVHLCPCICSKQNVKSYFHLAQYRRIKGCKGGHSNP